jgi:hypothetical protein
MILAGGAISAVYYTYKALLWFIPKPWPRGTVFPAHGFADTRLFIPDWLKQR